MKRLRAPLVVFAGGRDRYRNECRMASLDSTLAAAATAAGKPFKLIVYPEAERAYCFFAGIDHDRGKRNGTLYRNGILYSVASRDGHRIYGAPLA